MTSRKRLLVLCLLAVWAGCAPRVRWDPDWIYEGVVTYSENQRISVTSDPPAFLWVNGEFSGRTPATIALPYSRSEIRLLKQQYRERGEEREVLDSKRNIRHFSAETGHRLLFRAAGHHDRAMRIEIPRESDHLTATLRPRSGPAAAMECRLTVTAPPVFFGRIDRIVRENALSPGILREPETPKPLGPADLARQTLRFTVSAPDVFARIVEELHADARRRNVIFEATEAETRLALAANPEREFRAVWISYIDWPGKETDPEAQRRDLVEMLEAFRRLHFNAVFFHARIAGDTYYDSPLEPWSELLTGRPDGDPGYDPLALAVAEAHRRGMELHAWINPYRVRLRSTCGDGGDRVAKTHVARRHPDWVLQFRLGEDRCYRMLDPGRPEVVEHTRKVVEDLVRRYDVDGIHIDDTFYPYPQSGFPGVRNEDAASFRRHGGGRALPDWRRGNVDRLVREINETVKGIKPHVRLGISPFGIWRPGVPAGTRGMGAYDAIYSDAMAWLEAKTIDYLAPQLYWTIGDSPDYERLLDWWGDAIRKSGRHLYPGQIVYYVEPGEGRDGGNHPGSTREILRQVLLNRNLRDRNVLGNALYRARGQTGEILGTDALREMLETRLYATPALPPAMPWLETPRPEAVRGLRLVPEETGGAALSWSEAGDVRRYAIYAVAAEDTVAGDPPADAARLVAVTGETELNLPAEGGVRPGDLLWVRAVSRTNEEGPPGDPIRWPVRRPIPGPPEPKPTPDAEPAPPAGPSAEPSAFPPPDPA